jgi:hypothetical protein
MPERTLERRQTRFEGTKPISQKSLLRQWLRADFEGLEAPHRGNRAGRAFRTLHPISSLFDSVLKECGIRSAGAKTKM